MKFTIKNPPIAVLMSVYQKDTLEQVKAAIESIRNQDYGWHDIRVYLGIDGPVPEELDTYVQTHKHYFHRIVRNKQNLGLAATLNRLIDILEDEKYAFRMDSDDIALSYRFRLQVEFMETHSDIDISGGSIVEFDETGSAVMARNYPQDTAAAREYICKASPLAHMTVCFRTSLLKEKNYRYPQVKSSQDIRLWHQVIAGNHKIANMPLPLVLVRMNTTMLKRRSLAYGLREFDAFLLATYQLHGMNWRLIYPFARLVTRFSPSWLNRVIYRKFRWLLNPSRRKNALAKEPIRCLDHASKQEEATMMHRILTELCGLSEEQIGPLMQNDNKAKAA